MERDTPRSSNGIGDFLSRGGNLGSTPSRGATLLSDPTSWSVAERSAYQNGYEAGQEPLVWVIKNLLTDSQLDVEYQGKALRFFL